MCKAHTVLQELQGVELMLHKMAFQLSNKVVALLLNNCTVKAYLCNQGSTASSFILRIACYILNLANLQTYPSQCGNWKLVLEWNILPCIAEAVFQLWGQPEVDLLASSHSNKCLHYCILKNALPLGTVRLMLSILLGHSRELCFLLHFSPGSIQVNMSQVNSDFYSKGTFLDGGFKLPTVLNMFEDILPHYPIINKSCFRCFGGPGAQGFWINAA